jgi:hypothetical protein
VALVPPNEKKKKNSKAKKKKKKGKKREKINIFFVNWPLPKKFGHWSLPKLKVGSVPDCLVLYFTS